MDTYNRIHLCHSVPYGTTKRAKALCGAKLRDGHIYDCLLEYVSHCGSNEEGSWTYMRVNGRHTQHRVATYHSRLCPECQEHPDTALALLAHTG